MRKAFEKKYGKIENRFDPGRYFLGVKLEEICNNDPQLEEMQVVTYRKSGEEEFLHAEVEQNGRIKVRKGGSVAVDPPSTAEELRSRYELIANAWLYAMLRHPGRCWLKDMDRDVYRNFANYILGPSVAGLEDKAGRKPFFGDIMHYERMIRERAYELVRDGDEEDIMHTLKGAIKKACKDPEIRQLHFINRFSDHADEEPRRKPWQRDDRGAKRERDDDYAPDWSKGGKGKGKGKAKGKGKEKDGKKLHTTTFKGQPICFDYNNGKECDGKCGMVHCCQICLAGANPKSKAHPACEHSKNQKRGGKGN